MPDSLRLFLGHAFFDGLRSSFDQVFRFLQTKCGNFANDLDNVDLLSAGRLKNDIEFRLFFGRSCRFAAARGRCRRSGW